MKKIIKILLVIIVSMYINVNASTNTYDRETLPNYGVNKNWNINSSNINEVLNTYAVNASEKIYDFGEILTAQEEKELMKTIDAFIRRYRTDIIILTDDLRYMSDYENEEFAANFYDYNDFGIDFNNSGILLFRNTYASDPYYNIYAFGDAQLYMSYDRMEATLDHIYDYIHNKNYLAGFTKFVNDVSLYYGQGIPKTMKDYEVNQSGYLKKKFNIPWFEVSASALIVTIIIMFIMIKQNYMVTKATRANQYINRFKSKMTNRKDVFLSSTTRTYNMSSGMAGSAAAGAAVAKGITKGIAMSGTRIGSSGGSHRSGGGRHG